MKNNSLAKRYAKAIIDIVENEKEYENLRDELINFAEIIKANAEFKAGMETSLFSNSQKIDLLKSIDEKIHFNKKSFRFIQEIIEANRLAFIDNIIESMEAVWFEKTGVEKFTVYSAVKLNPSHEKKLIKTLEKKMNKRIVLKKKIDESLIAGIKLQKGSIYYDFSIEGNLKKLYETLIEGSDENLEI